MKRGCFELHQSTRLAIGQGQTFGFPALIFTR
ncbi:unnamed protein product [Protopolystoma xenopodis]|uniref:Uncharacterized protein n=1 Tax=Protopolystoma xenopodis TaxID=117903 RepID=A0A448WIY9_9PLAT|nr:unnamed protein product [Protopolystoma xenopodis]